ncbi:MAG: UDP-N-acetylmuramate dehydrogenase [Clostridium sp.]|nr:UDP-N-acetylmuramate dehydrogenase [Clostridium sp.]
MTELINLLDELKCEYKLDEPMKKHTTFRIGGNARLVVYPENEEQISRIVKCTKNNDIRLLVIGNGSNLLVDDDGIDACVMILDDHFSGVQLIDDETIYAKAGTMLIRVCKFALEHNLSGLEFAYGIPGSCGGGAFMNAGAYGGEMKDVLYKCTHIDSDGNAGCLEGKDMKLSYRHSAYYDNNCIITGLYLKLKKGNREEIKAKMDDLLSRRKDKQPLEFASAGSTFKRPEGYYAGALIQECNLKGKRVGDAQVSEKHAGFVINRGNASCRDVLELCRLCSDTVYNEKGVKLEMEIRVTR